MLTVELKTPKNLDLSKSSLIEEESNTKQLRNLVQDQERTIRKLIIKVSRLQQALSKERTCKKNSSCFNQNQQLLTILKLEIDKAREAEQTLQKFVQKIYKLSSQLGSERLIQESPEKKTRNLHLLNKKHPYMTIQTQCPLQSKQNIQATSDHQPVLKQFKLLQNVFRTFYEQQKVAKLKIQQLAIEKKSILTQLNNERQTRIQVQKQLQMERRTRIKIKRLLQKSQFEKNQLMIKIDEITLKQSNFSVKNPQDREYLIKYLYLRINDLYKQRKQLLKESKREKQVWNKNYSQLLKSFRSVQLIRK